MSDTVYVLDQVGIRLVKEKTLISDTQLKRPEQVVGFVSDILREYDREVMCVICLNAKLNPVNMCICSMGAVDKAIASPREIMKTAILSNANDDECQKQFRQYYADGICSKHAADQTCSVCGKAGI